MSLPKLDLTEFGGLPELDLAEFGGSTEEPAAKKSGNAVTDLGVSFAGGANALLEGAGTLYGLATGDMDNLAREQGASGRKYWEEKKSAGLKDAEAARRTSIDEADGELAKAGTAFWETVKNPALLSSFTAEQIPMFLPIGMAGRAGSAASMTTGAAGKVAGMASKGAEAIQSGSKVAQAARGGLIGLNTAEKAAGAIGTGVAIGTGAALQGADVGGDAYEELMKMPDSLWDLNPDYQNLRAEVGDEQAKQTLSLDLARQAATDGGVASVLTNMLPFARTFERATAGAPTSLKGGLLARGMKGFAGEAMQEASEEGLGRVAVNRAAGEVDPTRELSQGVGEAAGLGAIGGGVMGGAMGAISKPQEDNAPAATPASAPVQAPAPTPAPVPVKAPTPTPNDILAAPTVDDAIQNFVAATDSIPADELLSNLDIQPEPANAIPPAPASAQPDLRQPVPAGNAILPTAGTDAGAATGMGGPAAVGDGLAAATPGGSGSTASVDARVSGGSDVAVASPLARTLATPAQANEIADVAEKSKVNTTAEIKLGEKISPNSPAPQPVFGTNARGNVTLRGVPQEQIKAVRDKLKLKNVYIGKDNALFPKGTDLNALKAEFGVAPEQAAPKQEPAQNGATYSTFQDGRMIRVAAEGVAPAMFGAKFEKQAQEYYEGLKSAENPKAFAEEWSQKVKADSAIKPAEESKPSFIKAKDVYGETIHVKQSDLDGDRIQIPLYTAAGERKSGTIHRDNIDIAGDKRDALNAESADNPMFNVITAKNGAAFASKPAAQRELNKQGRTGTHEIVPASEVSSGANGFVLRKKSEESKPEATKQPTQQQPVVKDNLTTQPESSTAQDGNLKQASEFIKSPDGSIDFGKITAEQAKVMGRQAGNIRLERGAHNADGTGYGLAHIEANHGKQIRGAGFDSIEEFVAHVAKDFGQVWQSSGRQMLVAYRDGEQHMMYVQLEPAKDESGDYYRVNSAFPVRQEDYPERHGFKKLWDGSEPASAVTGEQPAYAGQSENPSGQTTPNARGQSDSNIRQQSTKSKAKKLEVLKAQAQGKITGDQGAALKELAEQGEHAAVDEVLNPSEPTMRDATTEERIASEKAAPVNDLHNKPTGWKRVEGSNGNSLLLVSYDGKKAVPFVSADKRSGAASKRMKAEAHAYAIDNPYTGEAFPEGELVSQPLMQPSQPAQAEQAGVQQDKIEDFGEKISGARKEYAAAYKDRMAEAKAVDILAEPLSKSWPEPDYQKLIDAGADNLIVGLVRSIRDEVPNKPQKGWKLKGWADQVQKGRELANDLLNDKTFADKFIAEMKKVQHIKLDDVINGRAELYALVGHEKSLKGVRISRGEYGVYNGQPFNPPKIIWEVTKDAKASAFGNMPKTLGSGETRQAAIESFQKAYATLDTSKEKDNKTKFELYANRYAKAGDKGQFFIGKKVGRNVMHLKDGFDTVKEARAYMAEHNDELAAILEKKKEIPSERYDTNKPRVGQDMRNGQDVTPQMFSDAFSFRGVQFGNYVEGARRQKDLNDAYDALMDLAAVLDIPPKALSLNGELGLAFGARGKGAAGRQGGMTPSAHYESGEVVINLTKGSGAGSLAHEWWHSLDNYFSRMAGKKDEMATDRSDVSIASRSPWKDSAYPFKNEGIRKEMVDAFGEVVKAIRSTAIKQRSSSLDSRRTKEYWGTGTEMSARAFERYVIAKLHDNGFANDYLANVVSEEYWNAAEALGIGEGGSYPYPTESELPAIRAGFDKFFETIETKETDKGVALFSFAGKGAKTADAHALTTAQERLDAGEDADTVRKETGWFKGADGKWRFEIDDSDAKLKKPWPSKGQLFGDILDVMRKRRFSETGSVSFTVGDVLDHPALFAAYPELAEIALTDQREAGASYSPKGSDPATVRIGRNEAMADVVSKLLHELQHAIQRGEGFATGGTEKNAMSAQVSDEARRSIARNTVEKIADKNEYSLTYAQKNDIAEQVFLWEESDDNKVAELQKATGLSEDQMAEFFTQDTLEIYRRLAGEVESRNTQARQRMTAEQRRNASPESTADVKAPDVIVVFNGKEMHDAPTPANVRDDMRGGMSVAAVKSITDPIAAKLKNIRTVKVVASQTDIPGIKEEIDAAFSRFQKNRTPENLERYLNVAKNDIEGAYTNGELYLVAANLRNAERVQEVLRHEVAHLSVKQMLEEVKPGLYQQFVNNIKLMDKAGNKYIRELAAAVDRTQPGLDANRRAEEIIAQIAERGDHEKDMPNAVRSLWQRIIDGIKAFHELVFGEKLSDQDARDIVAQSFRWARGEGDAVRVIGGVLNEKAASLSRGDDLDFAGRQAQDAAEDVGRERYQRIVEKLKELYGGEEGYESLIVDARRYLRRYPDPSREYLAQLFSARKLKEGSETVRRRLLEQENATQGSSGAGAAAFAALESRGRIGNFDGYVTEASLQDIPHYGNYFAMEVWPAEFDGKDGYLDSPILTLTLNPTDDTSFSAEKPHGELVIYGPKYDSETFRILQAKGWAEVAKGKDGDTAYLPDGKPWTRLTGVTPAQLTALLSDAHARIRLATGAEHLGVNWDRATGATGFATEKGDKEASRKSAIYFSRAQALDATQSANPASWDAAEPSMFDDVVYKLQDKNIDLKRVIQAIRESGTQIPEKYDAYRQEELFHGRAAKRVQDFVNTELKPLLVDMQARGLKMEELDQYLHARHAKEANALIAQRDPDMPDGGSGMTNEQADDYLAELPETQKKKLEAVAGRVDAIITRTRELYVSYGLISREQADSWAKMFQHYVPLMREDHDGGMGIGQGFSVKGKEAKHRTGSTAKVVDIFANIAMQREKAVVRGEKNRVAVSLAGLAKLNPNPDIWGFGPVSERRYNENTGTVEVMVKGNWKSADNVVVAKIKDATGGVQEVGIVFNEHNERAMRMAEAIKNLDASQLNMALAVSAVITRWFASVNTQFNPIFGVTNLVRDVQGAALNLTSTPLAGKQKEVLSHIASAAKGIYLDARSERKGKPATSKWAGLWEELQNEGGMTGYRDLYRTSADRAKAIEHELDPHNWVNSKWGKVFTANGMLKVPLTKAQDVAGPIFDWLSDYNLMMEGSTRLAIYKTAIDHGLSKQDAASLAKNTTVNFNRKGQAGQQAGALYAFFNAAMQGTARIGQTVFDMDNGDVKTLRLSRTGKAIVGGGVMLGVMQTLALALAGFDDDEPPEFIRERSLVIPIGGKKYISIPMPLGFHVLPNIGRISTEFALGGFRDPADHVIRLTGVFLEAFNPIGSAGMSMQTFMPTAIDPMMALAENRDWTGKTIYKEDFDSMRPTPGFTRNKDTASAWSKFIAEGINFASGGSDYTPGRFSPTADQIDYLIGQVTGGVGRELSKLAQTGESFVTGEDLPTHKVPLFGRFYGNAENQSSQGNRFYANLQEINKLDLEIKGRREDRLSTKDFMRENPKYRLISRAKYADNIIGKLRKRKRELIEQDAPRASIRGIEERITQEMLRFNQAVERMEAS